MYAHTKCLLSINYILYLYSKWHSTVNMLETQSFVRMNSLNSCQLYLDIVLHLIMDVFVTKAYKGESDQYEYFLVACSSKTS